ncbi:MAG: thiamine pyrophosphate-binding protein [Actinobacteria bacterium]|nr:thiamine pyrophosphate-binding protein [Actinomycetota bacterium]
MATVLQKEALPKGRVRMTAAEAIVRILELKGVEMVFGIPGAAILPVYDALTASNIQSYVVPYGQTAAFMADGYARTTGKVGVCMATSGPASTNFVTGLYGAWFDSLPVVAFTGQVPVPMIGTAAFQEAPTTAVVAPVTKKAYLPREASQVPAMVWDAFKTATSGRKGPVLVDLPLDVQKTVIEVDFSEFKDDPETLPEAGDDEIQKAVEMIKAAQRPVLLVGGGIVLAEAWEELKELAETAALPVVTTLMGKDSFPADHPLAAGMMGTICTTPLGNKTILDSDLVINLGGRFGDRGTGKVSVLTAGRKFIHVNLDPKELGKSVPADLGVVSDVRSFMKRLTRALKAAGLAVDYRTSPRVKELAEDRTRLARKTDFDSLPMKPQRALAELRRSLDRDAVVTHDCGISQIWSAQLFDAYEPRTYLVTGGAGTMGWGLGAAMAAKLARPKAQCVNIVGDGSLGMSMQDIATAVKFNIPVVMFLLNNSILGLIRQQQNWYFGQRHISTDLDYENPECGHSRGIDWVTVARGMGAGAELVERPEEIGKALERAFTSGRPYLIEVLVDPLAVCSMSNDGTLTGVQETA